jgi:hypothetical protein
MAYSMNNIYIYLYIYKPTCVQVRIVRMSHFKRDKIILVDYLRNHNFSRRVEAIDTMVSISFKQVRTALPINA